MSNGKRKVTKAPAIWPSIVGTIMVFILFQFIFAVFAMSYLVSLINCKFEDCKRSSNIAYEAIVGGGADANAIALLNRMAPNFDGYCILDKNGMYIASYDCNVPDTNVYRVCNFFEDFNGTGIYLGNAPVKDYNEYPFKFYVSKNFRNFLDSIKGGFVSPGAMLHFFFRDDYYGLEKESIEIKYGTEITYRVYCVFDMPDSTDKIWIESLIVLTGNELTLLIISAGFVIVLFVAFMAYHISSIVRLIRTKTAVTSILYKDVVTAGKNKLYFTRKGHKLLLKNSGGANKLCVVHVRLEKYKGIMSFMGSKGAETLLTSIYDSFASDIKKGEIVSHFELGDFALMLKYRDEKALETRIRKMLNKACLSTTEMKLYFNVGLRRTDGPVKDISILYNDASVARATNPDENAEVIVWFNDMMHEDQLWEIKVESEMDAALANKEFLMYLQPKYSTGEEKLAAAEALCRWKHPKDGLIPPYKFIPIFEKNGFILKLDDYMINAVAAFQKKCLDNGKTPVPISVNVSRAHFMQENLAEHIRDLVDKYEVPHKLVEIELTESAFFDDKKVLINTVQRMREYGFPVSMDDFGAGYSSLNTLKEIPLDVIKIDAEFFRGEGSESRGRLIVGDTIDMSKKLGMEIVAEGIETREQVDFLRERGCDLIQGYYFAKPMPTDDFEVSAFGEKL